MSNTPKTHEHSGTKKAPKPRGVRKSPEKARRCAISGTTNTSARHGTKQAILIEMLSRAKGATIEEMAAKSRSSPLRPASLARRRRVDLLRPPSACSCTW